jgi:HAD superfamily hydrolase (TIGR01509 family)
MKTKRRGACMEKAFIFDLDGVIINSEPIHDLVDIDVATAFEIQLDHQRLQKYVGMRSREVWESIIKEDQLILTSDELLAVADVKKEKYIAENELQPINGIKELLIELKEKDYRIALASSSPKRFIEAVLNKFEIHSYFEYKVSGDEVKLGKPDPEIYLLAAQRLNVDPKNCIVLEDSKNGVAAGNDAGMKTIGFANPGSGNQDLSKANHIVHSIDEVLSIL